ncbi:MAG: PQQ-binding-like beta-propeller repeat protein [Bacteroidetes bacterium]|nr:PQQ-binding-like beta-propeller repeat protein [Bacteroidota bacterium]MBU1115758.1 PQQ-binding-like beta-propeller repeat protein [Bacteroidota bacterium]MBU1799454.1 PQQ-binding-like beta-propeller repeat protein [Bacteroidota bacterium]
MKKIFFWFLLITTTFFAQQKFAWITDTHIGFDSADVELKKIVEQINSIKDVDFILATGDITEKSKNSEFDQAKQILDNLEKPLLIIPGNHDTKWSNSGGSKFTEIWDDDKFIYKKNKTVFIGISSAIPLVGGGGHIKPGDIKWLNEELARIDSSYEIIFATHHPLNSEIDNWFEVTNILRNYKIKAILYGHGHKTEKNNFNGIPAVMARATISKNQKSYGFMLVENLKDKINFFEVDDTNIPQFWGEINKNELLKIPLIDSTQFINYNTEILFQKNIKTTLVAPPLFWNDKVYVADYTGLVSCFNLKGKLIWDYDTFGDITAKPIIIEDKLVVTTVQGELTIFDAVSGEQIETIGFDDYIVAPPVFFNHTGVKNLILPKQTSSSTAIIIATASGKIYCYDFETLQEIWTNKEAKDMIETAPLVIGNQIIFGSWDTNIYSIDANNGSTIWKWKGNKSFYYSPAACQLLTDGQFLYFTSPDKLVHAIDLRLGTTKWEKKDYNAWESIGISKNKKELYIKSVEDKLFVISAKNGSQIKTINVGFGLDTMPTEPIEWNNKIVFSSQNGNIYRINEKLKYKSVLFLGNARVHSVQIIDDKRLMASNMDGNIVIFNIVSD